MSKEGRSYSLGGGETLSILHSWMELFIVLLLVLFCFFIYIFPLALHVKIQSYLKLFSLRPLTSAPRTLARQTSYLIWRGVLRTRRVGVLDASALGRMLKEIFSCSKGTPSITTVISAPSSFPLLFGLQFSIFFSSVSPISSMLYDLSTIWDSSKSLVYCRLPF